LKKCFLMASFCEWFSSSWSLTFSFEDLVLTDIPHTWTFVPYDTKSQVCDVGIPSIFRQLEVPSV